MGSPENIPATLRGFPGSALTFCGRASIFGGTPVNKERDKVSERFQSKKITLRLDHGMMVT